jgi:elongation factor 1-alpha
MNRRKPHIQVVLLGNVDSGKTTLAGHLTYKCGVIDKRIFDRFEKEAIEVSFSYSFINHVVVILIITKSKPF